MGALRGVFAVAVLFGLGLLPPLALASPPPGSDPVVEEWPHWPYPVSCGPLAFDPVAVFTGPAGAESGALPSEAGLREVLADPALAWLGLPAEGWRLASENATVATFIAGRAGVGLQRVSLEQIDGHWKWVGNGTCSLASGLPERLVVSWNLTAEQPGLRPGTRRLEIAVSGGPCNGGQPFIPRKPVFRQFGKRLLMTMSIEPPPPGPNTCQAIRQPPVIVALPGRLGERKLYDGATYPPLSAAATRGPGF